MNEAAPLLRRLNGRPQACDPCRARKVACDHGQPTCSRCRKRREACVYTISEPRTKRQRLRSPIDTETRTTSNSTPSPSVAPGYLGFTSHNAVFEETRNSLSLAHGSAAVEAEPNPRRAPRTRACLIEMPPHLREMCFHVLRNLPGAQDDVLGHRVQCRIDEWILGSIQDILATLQQDWGECLASRDTAQLEELGLAICNNTSRPLGDVHSSGKAWLDQLSGPNLRWESIGLIWTYWGGSPSYDISNVATCLGYCIELARHFSSGNDVLLHLCYRRSISDSLSTGDASSTFWRSLAEAVALLTFLGLHVGSDDTNYVPSLCSEHKRRTAARVFVNDKIAVSFTGRPPLLSRRYFSCPLPLAIGDQDLLGDEATARRAIQALDENGYDPDGDVLGAALVRSRTQIALIKDELLEMALSNSVKATFESLSEIKDRARRTYKSFPPNLIHRAEEFDGPDWDMERVYARMVIRLEHLQNLFFAERLLLRLGHVDENSLLPISFEMVTLTLLFWTHQDRFAGVRKDFEWLLMAFAAPGGGILCLELLRPTFSAGL
ncbi:hypothetical protein F66182_8542 [Fusarium sp. NRRL 66182]|nr:hypothetical protein F66182_8542 [Fusarium sp. NRRL 66182]